MKKTGEPIEGYVEGEDVLVYHYGKPGEHLKNADESVKSFYAQKQPKGIFQWLVHSSSSRLLLITIIALIIIIGIINFVDKGKARGVINGISTQLTAFSFEDTIYASIKLAEADKIQKNSVVTVFFEAIDSNGQLVAEKQITDFYTGKEIFLRTTFTNYDIISINAKIEFENKYIDLTSQVISN